MLIEDSNNIFQKKETGNSEIFPHLIGKNVLGQKGVLEKLAMAGQIDFDRIIKLFKTKNDNQTRLAIIELLSQIDIVNNENRAQAAIFLKDIVLNYIPNEHSIRLPYSENFSSNDQATKHIEQYELGIADDYDRDILFSASLVSLSKMGEAGEEALLSILDQNIKKRDRERISYASFDILPEMPEDEYEEEFQVDELDYHVLNLLAESGSKKTIDFITDRIKNNLGSLYVYNMELHNTLKQIDAKYAVENILNCVDQKKQSESHIQSLIILTTDLVGTGETLQKINDLIIKSDKEGNQNAAENLKNARAYLVPTKDKEVFAKLEDFYRKFNIKEHQLNKDLNEKEISLLKELIPSGSKALESGCGTGRLLLEMKKSGYDISGYDLTPENIDEVKKKDPEARVSIEDWHHTPYQDHEFDAVYSLGRNILHEYSLPGQVQLFRETARVLKPGGKFIFDIPDREKGVYAENIKEYKKTMNDKGIYNLREGTVHDSPDGEHFSTRYCPSHEDIENLARLIGFRIARVRREPLPTGKGDENLYYVLEKI